MKVDCHTHSFCSHDGKASIADMIKGAKERDVSYFAVTEHADRDYLFLTTEQRIRQLDYQKYRKTWEEAVRGQTGIKVLYGVECGFTKDSAPVYKKELAENSFDVIINSVHTVNGHDAYFQKSYDGKTEKEVYSEYLTCVLDSIKADYPYDVVAHIGYVLRYAPFENKSFLSGCGDLIDEILKEIVDRGKTLELNTNVKDLPTPCLPQREIFHRYRELGGENISFGSDAHLPERILDKYDQAVEIVKNLGFKYWTIYEQRKEVKVKID